MRDRMRDRMYASKGVLKKKLQVQRITPQRIILFEVIKQQHGHLHVEEIYGLARKKDPNINISTVYRTLNEFKKAGIVDELHFEQDHHHYESSDKKDHNHLICEKCGRVIDFQSKIPQNFVQETANKHDFSIFKVNIQMRGVCKKCLTIK